MKNVINQVRDFVETVRRRHGINWLEEIHTKNLVEGSREWHGIDMGIRVQVFDDFANLITGLDVLLNIVVVMKASKDVVIRRPDEVRRYAIMNSIERMFMTKPLYPSHSMVILVFDEPGGMLNVKIKGDIEYAIKNSRAKQTYDRIFNVFKSSVEEPPLQLADYVAYVVRRVFKGQLQHGAFSFRRAFQLFEGRIRRCPNGNTYHGCGLKVWELR